MTEGSAMRMEMSENQAVPTVQFENDHLRVTEWRFSPGATTGYHRHGYDYVVVPVVDGELELVEPAVADRTRGWSKGNHTSAKLVWSTTSSMAVPPRWSSSKSNSRTPPDRL
jgi:hypothetical protein